MISKRKHRWQFATLWAAIQNVKQVQQLHHYDASWMSPACIDLHYSGTLECNYRYARYVCTVTIWRWSKIRVFLLSLAMLSSWCCGMRWHRCRVVLRVILGHHASDSSNVMQQQQSWPFLASLPPDICQRFAIWCHPSLLHQQQLCSLQSQLPQGGPAKLYKSGSKPDRIVKQKHQHWCVACLSA